MGCVVSPMPREIILASGFASRKAVRRRAISGNRYLGGSCGKGGV
jgi:hypothetical protein